MIAPVPVHCFSITFLNDDWPKFLAKYTVTDKNIIITGDLNFHLDNVTNHATVKFTSVLQSCGMLQHVKGPTHALGHTLDVIITRDTDNIVSNIEVIDPGLSDGTGKVSKDHFAVTFNTNVAKPAPIRKTVTFRKLRSIDVDTFNNELTESECLRSCGEISDPEELVGTYTNVLNEMIEKYAPLRTKTITLRPTCPWFTEELHAAKHTRRKLERKWRNSGLAIDHEIYRKYCAEVNKKLQKTRETYLSEKFESCGRDQKTMFKITKTLLDGPRKVSLPTGKTAQELSQECSDFFIDKVEKIRSQITSQNQTNMTQIDENKNQHEIVNRLIEFNPASEEELKK